MEYKPDMVKNVIKKISLLLIFIIEIIYDLL